MRIRRKFVQLTRYTYPHGTEDFLKFYLPDGYEKDPYGNYYFLIGDNPKTMFTCHLDTACSKQVKVNHFQSGNIIKTDGKSILGADDKAGMVVILNMIENKVPGLYYFFIGEEVGCVGSRRLSKEWSNFKFNNISKVISFDRRSDCSVITHQWYGRCCSDSFAKELSLRLNSVGQGLKLQPDDTGVLTDSAQFMDIIPECTNISVGYMYEHTVNEYQDIDFLQRLCKAVCMIDWETLPVERNPNDRNQTFEFSDNDDNDNEYTEEYYSFFNISGKSKKMYISNDLIAEEHEIIYNWLLNNGYNDMKKMSWNGHKCYAQDEQGHYNYVGSRPDLMEFISELCSVPLNKIKEAKEILA